MSSTDPLSRVLPGAHVKLLAVDGDDRRIARRARMSYDRRDDDNYEGLVRDLVEHYHTGPLEFCTLQFEVQAPLAIVQQLLRHRTFRFNQLSMRYVAPPEELHEPDAWRVKGGSSKQGSVAGDFDADERIFNHRVYSQAVNLAEAAYLDLTEAGVAPEQARFVLPQAQHTRICVSADLNNLFKYLRLRLHPHAQLEHRVIAVEIAALAREHFPVAYAAFEEFWLLSTSLSRTEGDTLCFILDIVDEHIRRLSARTVPAEHLVDNDAAPNAPYLPQGPHGLDDLLRGLGYDAKTLLGSERRMRTFLRDKLGRDLDLPRAKAIELALTRADAVLEALSDASARFITVDPLPNTSYAKPMSDIMAQRARGELAALNPAGDPSTLPGVHAAFSTLNQRVEFHLADRQALGVWLVTKTRQPTGA